MSTARSTRKYPPGWNEERVRKVLDHYEKQTEDEAIAEDEAAWESCTMIAVPKNLVPAVCALLDRETKRAKKNGKSSKSGRRSKARHTSATEASKL